MMQTESRYVNMMTDFGFKLIFRQAELLISFLNALFEGEKVVKSVVYNDKESQVPESDRTTIYDIYCTAEDGEEFIVEMQNKGYETFRDRGLYYVSRAIVEQGQRGKDWNYDLRPVYGIFFMNFHLDGMPHKPVSRVRLTEDSEGKVFTNALQMVFIDLPSFKKTHDECNAMLDKWLYSVKNLGDMKSMPFENDSAFGRVASLAELAVMPQNLKDSYYESLKRYRDWYTVLTYNKKTSFEEGVESQRPIIEEMGRQLGEKDRQIGDQARQIGDQARQIDNQARQIDQMRNTILSVAAKSVELGTPLVEVAKTFGVSVSEIEEFINSSH